ncbi:hypothetical protein RFI_31236 [Reticulomyxa filosa]|uniref:RING-type domain-containing protein n=1 Tax=Reticulomyxa filosa TaxID=46433 RepID=X6LZJ5_RETFI|nr:hypothetical protein RFI_31236 [Reticulomyxa filosa]|eukprot:ETO06160.1 hypothetical protein RFI_31236 [Reticulomyxa filosa]
MKEENDILTMHSQNNKTSKVEPRTELRYRVCCPSSNKQLDEGPFTMIIDKNMTMLDWKKAVAKKHEIAYDSLVFEEKEDMEDNEQIESEKEFWNHCACATAKASSAKCPPEAYVDRRELSECEQNDKPPSPKVSNKIQDAIQKSDADKINTALLCGMCHKDLRLPCASCHSQERALQECPITQGDCKHMFHVHCLEQVLRSRFRCPICVAQLS